MGAPEDVCSSIKDSMFKAINLFGVEQTNHLVQVGPVWVLVMVQVCS